MPTLALPSTLTHAEVAQCLQALATACSAAGSSSGESALRSEDGPSAQTLVADASALSHFDSSALAVLLEARRLAIAQAMRFSVQGLPARLAGLAALYGVSDLLVGP
jgi:phospholipid transport system transporter-binding protein